MVRESRLHLTDRALTTMICHSQEKQKFHATGPFGMWSASAEKALLTALLPGKRTSKQSTSTSTSPAKAIQDIKVDHKTIEDIKVKHKAPENIEAADGSAESSVKHEKDPTNEKHPTSDKDSSEDSSSDDQSSGSSTDSLPEYTKWSSDWPPSRVPMTGLGPRIAEHHCCGEFALFRGPSEGSCHTSTSRKTWLLPETTLHYTKSKQHHNAYCSGCSLARGRCARALRAGPAVGTRPWKVLQLRLRI